MASELCLQYQMPINSKLSIVLVEKALTLGYQVIGIKENKIPKGNELVIVFSKTMSKLERKRLCQGMAETSKDVGFQVYSYRHNTI